jgi:CheY-like chemotaxis protein
VDTVRPAALAKRLDLQVTCDPSLRLLGDADRLLQIFWNLLQNAVKFTPPGGRVRVVGARAGSAVEVTVEDTGIGLDPEFLPHVFDAFRQAESGASRRHGGLGLGLALVRQLTEMHGGTVEVLSGGPGQGSRFKVSFPVPTVLTAAEEEPAVPEAETPPPPPFPPVPLDGLAVLVVDDDADARDSMAAMLALRGARVKMAASAAEALLALETDPVDILVADIGMPDEDGYALIRRVRALASACARLPALALTAYARPEDQEAVLAAGFHVHVAKPVHPDELAAAIASLAPGRGQGTMPRPS